MHGRVNLRPSLVARAQRAIREAPDTRRLKAELIDRNPYVEEWLERQGVGVQRGAAGVTLVAGGSL